MIEINKISKSFDSHKIIEDGKTSVRNIRRDAIHILHDYGKHENIN